MLLQEKDQPAFKRWVLPRLETISEVDAEVLADFLIALVTTNDSEADIERNCVEQLSEFLTDNTERIVNDVLKALKDKTFLPGASSKLKASAPTFTPGAYTSSQPAPIPSILGTTNHEYEPHPPTASRSPEFNPPKGPAASRFPNLNGSAHGRPEGTNPSKKRKLVERERSHSWEAQDAAQYARNGTGSRPSKQTARRAGRHVQAHTAPQNGFPIIAGLPNLQNVPPPPPGPFPFDQPDHQMAFLAMAAAFGVNLPGMPQMPSSGQSSNIAQDSKPKEQCQNYLKQGYCTLGSFCPYEHGDAIVVPADKIPAYDPDQAYLAAQPDDTRKKSSARGPLKTSKGPRRRADFSQVGPSHDKSDATLVVEQIPEPYQSEEEVRKYFAEFGTIVDVQVQSHKQLAIIKFADHEAANRAFMSPKAVFENRFVKVFWYKTETTQHANGDPDMNDATVDEEPLNMEEFLKRQAEAQKAFEERRKKEEEANAHAEEIEKRLEAVNEEIRQVKKQLAELSGETEGVEEFSQSLANLQAEAEDLFAQHEPGSYHDSSTYSGRGRGAFRGGPRGRGYGGYAPRGRGYAPSFGGYRGRGHYAGAFQGGRSSVKRLDNRPRRLAVAHIEVDSAKDEALRQYLLNVPDCTSIDRHPEQADTLIISFNERYQAEMFLDDSLHIPGVGKLDLAWVPNDAFGGVTQPATTKADDAASDDGSSTTVGEVEIKQETDEQGHGGDADMDVADDVDEWL